MGYQLVSHQALAIGEFFLVRCVAATALGEPELAEAGLYGCYTTPQEVGDFLRRKALDEVFLLEKTLVEILGKC